MAVVGVAHNYYLQPGGEDRVYEAEAALLEARGCRVIRYAESNERTRTMGGLATARAAVWSGRSYRALRALAHRERPDVFHFHNIFPLISPSAYYAMRVEGVPVVQTLHNYRLACPAAIFYRRGAPCEDCAGRRVQWPAVAHGCYRGSRVASSAVAAVNASHRLLGTWRTLVDAYVALNEFSREKLVAAGLPEDRVFTKPNFLDPDPGPGDGRGGFALFVGRLSREKGVHTLLEAWRRLDRTLAKPIPLRIAGDGPLAPEVARAARSVRGVEWLGRRGREEVLALMGQASLLVLPSEWYECLPVTLVECFAKGTPALVSRLGAMRSLVREGESGFYFEPGSPRDLARGVERIFGAEDLLRRARAAARSHFLRHYGADANHRALMEIYAAARRHASAAAPRSSRPAARSRGVSHAR
jgi:glycosyltransferase involved in cell wall biosynthesis